MAKKCGKEKFIFCDGSTFDREFNNNNMHVHGTYRWGYRRRCIEDWLNNKMDEKGAITWPNGRCDKGYYIDDKKGFGTFFVAWWEKIWRPVSLIFISYSSISLLSNFA